MKQSEVNTLVIGAGQAGLAISRWLQKHGIDHAVLERGRIGESWREQRWDSFHLNTPNLMNVLPDDVYGGEEPSGFSQTESLVQYFEDYSTRHGLPVEEGVEVTAVRRVEAGFEVEAGGEPRRCRNLVLCCGDQNAPKVPALAAKLPNDLLQLHAADYRRPDQLPEGATVVVGSGQSGVQIVEDLLEAGRDVYVCTSEVGRAPRRYRGRDIMEWMQLAGLSDQRPEDLENPDELRASQPQISGTRGGHTVSLQQLARDGATLLGRLTGVRGRVLQIGGDLLKNVARGNEVSANLRGAVDMIIDKVGMDAPPASEDPADAPFDGVEDMAAVRELDIDQNTIRSVVWATGFGPAFGFLDSELKDENGRPRHEQGVCEVPGLYCLGFTWLRRRISGLIGGVDKDAEHIAGEIAARNG